MTQRRKVQSPRPKLLEFELEPLQFTIKFPDPQNVIGTRNLKLFADQLQDLQLTVTPLVQKRENGEVVEVMELEAIPMNASGLKEFADNFSSNQLAQAMASLRAQFNGTPPMLEEDG